MVHTCRSIVARWSHHQEICSVWGTQVDARTASFPLDVYFLCAGSTFTLFPFRRTVDSTLFSSPARASSLESKGTRSGKTLGCVSSAFCTQGELHVWANAVQPVYVRQCSDTGNTKENIVHKRLQPRAAIKHSLCILSDSYTKGRTQGTRCIIHHLLCILYIKLNILNIFCSHWNAYN